MKPVITIGQKQSDVMSALQHYYPKAKMKKNRVQINDVGVVLLFSNSILTFINKI